MTCGEVAGNTATTCARHTCWKLIGPFGQRCAPWSQGVIGGVCGAPLTVASPPPGRDVATAALCERW